MREDGHAAKPVSWRKLGKDFGNISAKSQLITGAQVLIYVSQFKVVKAASLMIERKDFES